MEKANFVAYGTLVTDTVKPFWVHALSISTNTVRRVAFWAKIGASPGMVGGSLWEVPMQEGVHPCQNGPQIPMENPLEARGVQRQLVPPRALVSRRWPCNRSRGGRAAGEDTPRRTRSRRHCRLGRRQAGVRPATSALLHPLLRQVARGGPSIRQNGGQVWAVLWSSYHPPPTTTRLRSREERLGLRTYVIHKTYQKKNCHNDFY